MSTFGELIQQASRRLQDENNTAVSTSIVGDAINTAMKYWKQERFWFNEFNTTSTLTIGAPVLSLSILYPLQGAGLRIIDQQTTYELMPLGNEQYDWSNIQGTGRPYGYTWRGGAYNVYYVPDQAYTVQVTGVKDYAPLVNTTDTNDFTNEADQLILYDALSRMTAELRTDPTISDYYTQRTQDEKRNLKRRTNKMIGTGRLQLDRSYYDNSYPNYFY